MPAADSRRPARRLPDVITVSAGDDRCLRFREFTDGDIAAVARLTSLSGSRACDFTVGGLYMWIDYFRYRCAFVADTLFVRGASEDDTSLTAFSLPVGLMPLADSVALLRRYCEARGMTLRFSAVPEDRLDELTALGARSVAELPDWADYVYDAASLASLSGKKLNKKRNHVNRFMADNPGYTLRDITAADIPSLLAFLDSLPHDPSKSLTAGYEREQTARVLRNYRAYPFVGAILSTPSRGIVAFTVGEVIGDTLHLHIEKADHTVAGAGEAINTFFARLMTARDGSIALINRQDDAGDPGLRAAKLSWHPAFILRKFNVIF